MERIVIVAYEPLPGKKEALEELAKEHWSRLNHLGFVSSREPIIVQAANGSIVEVFGWKSKEAMNKAHGSPEIREMWEEYAKVCTYIPVGKLEEANNLFSEFTPIDAG